MDQSLLEKFYSAMAQFPKWLEELDKLNMPTWTLIALVVLSFLGFIFAARELTAWFFKTNTIIDELSRLDSRLNDMKSDLRQLELTVASWDSALESRRLKKEEAENDIPPPPSEKSAPKERFTFN